MRKIRCGVFRQDDSGGQCRNSIGRTAIVLADCSACTTECEEIEEINRMAEVFGICFDAECEDDDGQQCDDALWCRSYDSYTPMEVFDSVCGPRSRRDAFWRVPSSACAVSVCDSIENQQYDFATYDEMLAWRFGDATPA